MTKTLHLVTTSLDPFTFLPYYPPEMQEKSPFAGATPLQDWDVVDMHALNLFPGIKKGNPLCDAAIRRIKRGI